MTPIRSLEAWRAVFPELFTDGSEIPPEIRQHIRYPEDIFTVQTDMWTNYVVDDATQFIEGALAWSIAAQPRIEAQQDEGEAGQTGAMSPQYLMARLPEGVADNDASEFVLQRAFVPRSGAAGTSTARPKLTGIMMARSDPENYGELVMVRLPGGQVDAPDLVHSEIRKNDDLTEFIKEKAGARVQFGEMSTILVDDTILFVRPVYVEANSATAVPELQRVVAVNGSRIFMGRSIEEAISGVVVGADLPAATGDEEPEAEGDSPNGTPPAGSYSPTGKSVVELIADAEGLLAAADSAEISGLTEEAASLRADAETALVAARVLLGGPQTTSPPPIPPTTQVEAEGPAEETAATG